MVRKLAFALLSLAVISPTVVLALGLGEIKLNSYLNQPLDARIEILSSTRGETDGMQVKLASPEAFERAGLEFTNNLRQLRFTITPRRNGEQYIQVTTRNGYREPFLNFLLEVNWSSGRILREYSELVDPPGLVRAAPPVTQAPRAATVKRAQPVTPQPRPSQPKQAYSSPRTSSAPATVSRSGVIGDTYKTQRNDTAWKIANQVRPDNSVTVEQAMMALLRANPNAFIKQNINRLKAGYILTIPDRDSMISQSHAAAVSEMRQQTREWRERKQASSAPEGRVDVLSPKPGTPTKDQTTASTGTGNAAELQREVMLAKEASEAQKQENAELRLRISQLEEQITNAKKLANLKADQLAALQKNLGELQEADSVASSEPMQAASQEVPEMPSEPVEEATAAQTEAATDEKPPVEKKISLANVVEAKPAPADSPVNQHVVDGFKRVDLSQLPASELPAQPFKTMAVDATPAEQSVSEDIVSQSKNYFEQNPAAKWIALAALILVLIIIAMIVTRRRRNNEDYEESILQEPVVKDNDSALQEAAVSSSTATVEVDEHEPVTEEQLDVVATDKSEVSDTSFLSDMILSDMSDMHGEGTQADPLTEADVFLAYGRFGPAENLIKGAIEKEPERNDLRLKLLEIYYSAKNKHAFLEEAKNLHEIVAVQPDPATWEKVVEMGTDLCPEDSLFTYQADAPVQTAAKATSEDDTEVMDFDLSEFESQIDDMDSGNDDELDLDLNALNENDNAADDLERTVEIPLDSEQGERLSQAADDDITREMIDDFNNIDDDITRELDIPDFEEENLGEDTDSTLMIDDELDLEDDSLDDIDEIGTKMDLARAYIDMGDPDGARSILEEVIEEGNEEQQMEARELMKKV